MPKEALKKAIAIYTGEGVQSIIDKIQVDPNLTEEEKMQKVKEIRSKQRVEQIKIRVPVAFKEKIEARANDFPLVKGRPSINQVITSLIAVDLIRSGTATAEELGLEEEPAIDWLHD